VEDGGQEVAVHPGRDRVEEVAGHGGEAPRQVRWERLGGDPGGDRRVIEEDPAQACGLSEDGAEEGAVAAAEVDQCGEGREVVGGDQGRVAGGVATGHVAVEAGADRRVGGQVREERQAGGAGEGRLADPHRVDEPVERPSILLPVEEGGRAGGVGDLVP
jgi:hypothetical protein